MNTLNTFRLDSKLAIVTGGAGLFGKSISRALAEAGAHVIIASRNLSRCKEFAEELKSEGWQADGMELDQGDEKSIDVFIDQVITRYQCIDVLINNCVTRVGMSDLEDATREGWEFAQKVNSTGLMLVTKGVIKHMKAASSGNIVNIGSIQGVAGPRFPVYGDSGMSSPINYTYDKWGMVGFTKWIANKYGSENIRCNCLSPGGYGPGVEASVGISDFYREYEKLTPLGRFATDDDLKGPIVFLASDASAYITGHNLLVDGGWSSW